MLAQAVEDAIRSYLVPWLHSRQRQMEAVERFHRLSLGDTNHNFTTSKTHRNSPIHTLARLNGYQLVSENHNDEDIALAEGVVVSKRRLNNRKDHTNTLLYAKEMMKEEDPTSLLLPRRHYTRKQRMIPAFIEEDITIYRVLENGVTVAMTSFQESLIEWFGSRVQRPLHRLASRFHTSSSTSTSTSTSDDQLQKDEKLSVPDDESSSTSIGPQQEQEVEPYEYLLVLTDDDSIRIWSHMTPSLRGLALPLTLGHKNASTLISVSLVVFGALPLAYRSLHLAVDYPLLSESIAVSVVATISYGIWSTRSNARTNQSRVIANALAWRMYARDDAAILLLQAGAIERLTKEVLHVYYHPETTTSTVLDSTNEQTNAKRHVHTNNSELLTPVEIALMLGMIQTHHPDGTTTAPTTAWIALPLADALANVTTKSQHLLRSL